MKALVAAIIATSFLGAMCAAQAGTPTTSSVPSQPHATKVALTAQPSSSKASSAPATVPGTQGAQANASSHIMTYVVAGGLIVVGGIILSANSSGNHSSSGTSGTTGTN